MYGPPVLEFNLGSGTAQIVDRKTDSTIEPSAGVIFTHTHHPVFKGARMWSEAEFSHVARRQLLWQSPHCGVRTLRWVLFLAEISG